MDANPTDEMTLTVSDVDATCAFYRKALGMEVIVPAEGGKALRFGPRTIRLHPESEAVEPPARKAILGSADLGFLTPTPLERVLDHFGRVGVEVEGGPTTQERPDGPVRSLYLRDPDGNRIEISNRVEA